MTIRIDEGRLLGRQLLVWRLSYAAFIFLAMVTLSLVAHVAIRTAWPLVLPSLGLPSVPNRIAAAPKTVDLQPASLPERWFRANAEQQLWQVLFKAMNEGESVLQSCLIFRVDVLYARCQPVSQPHAPNAHSEEQPDADAFAALTIFPQTTSAPPGATAIPQPQRPAARESWIFFENGRRQYYDVKTDQWR
ncbi:MAG: hypothetical protein ACK5NY_03870 [Burkholderiaceae bacterium]|jgi:hypothetical protein